MPTDSRTPVVVGVGIAGAHDSDGDAVDLMVEACVAAAKDAGTRAVLEAAGMVLVPRGIWTYPDPGRLVAEAIGNGGARTTLAELGVLQTTLVDQAATAIAAGDVDVAIVVGGEAKWRELQAQVAGTTLAVRPAQGAEPDVALRPHGAIVSGAEIKAGLTSATIQYAMIENARRHADAQSIDVHREEVAALASRFNAIAVGNAHAWHRTPMTAPDIATPGPTNRAQAVPYNKWHCSQWNVNQAAAVIMCSAGWARGHGLATDRWVFPHAVAWSDHMVPMTNRAELHRSPAFRLAAEALDVDGAAHLDFYSCFPIAVRTQALEMGIDTDRSLTVTGGMTFGGGPLNNYVLQSTAQMVSVLRSDPGSVGVVTAISGLITKQGVSSWSTEPPAAGYRSLDLTAEAADATATVPVVDGANRRGIVATYTAVFDRAGAPERGVVLVDLPTGERALAVTTDADTLGDMARTEWCGRPVALDGDGGFTAI